jgi:hypothetical protein
MTLNKIKMYLIIDIRFTSKYLLQISSIISKFLLIVLLKYLKTNILSIQNH